MKCENLVSSLCFRGRTGQVVPLYPSEVRTNKRYAGNEGFSVADCAVGLCTLNQVDP
jgi:hypothetical protein